MPTETMFKSLHPIKRRSERFLSTPKPPRFRPIGLGLLLLGLLGTGCGDDSATSSGAGGAGLGGSSSQGGGTEVGGGGAGAGTPSGAGGGECSAENTKPCYSGPASTEGVGTCKPGVEACDGPQVGVCVGEVVPTFDDCATALDEDCDGAVIDCSGQGVWARALGGNIYDFATGVAFDSLGNTVVTGFGNSFNLEVGGAEVDTDDYDFYIAKHDPTGQLLWEQILVEPGAQSAQGLGVGPDDSVFVAGYGGTNSLFVSRFDAQGELVWSRTFAMDTCDVADLAVDGQGNVIVTGCFLASGAPDFGGGPLPAPTPSNLYVAKLSSAGDLVFATRFASPQTFSGPSVATDSEGGIYLASSFSGDVDFDSGAVNTLAAGVQLTKLDPTGAHVFTTDSDGGFYSQARITVAPTGDILVVGGSSFGLEPQGMSAYVVRLDPSGNPNASIGFMGPRTGAVATDPAGNVVVAGSYTSGDSFGDGPQSSNGDQAFVTKLRPDLSRLWLSFGTNQYNYGIYPDELAISEQGRIAAVGMLIGSADFGSGPIVSHNTGNQDGFIAVLTP
jgi:hypothetical protein